MLHIRDLKSLFRIILISAAICSFYHISKIIIDPSLLNQSINEIRGDAGKGYFLSVLAIVIIAAAHRSKINITKNRWFVRITFVLCMFSLILSFSRTLWVSLLIMGLVIYDLLNLKKLKNIMLLIGIIIFFALLVTMMPESEQVGSKKTFMGKTARSFQETIVKNYKEKKDINSNWRGFEAFKALQTYLAGGVIQYIIGSGFGTLIDLGFYIELGGVTQRYIPYLHNGYMYILVKTGIIGICIYIFYFYKLIRYGKMHALSMNSYIHLAGKLIVAISLVILVTTLVISGFFNKGSFLPIIIILGSLIAYIGNIKNPFIPRKPILMACQSGRI